jgi:hypothetical protein
MTSLKGFSFIFIEYVIGVVIKVTGEHLRRNDDKYHVIKTGLLDTVYSISSSYHCHTGCLYSCFHVLFTHLQHNRNIGPLVSSSETQ